MGATIPDGIPYPDDYNDPADVPEAIKDLAEAVQAVATQQNDNIAILAPIGAIVMWPSAAAPPGWHLCNGTAHGSSQLQAILNSPNTPDLRDRFIVGAGNSYAVGATGGANEVLLSAIQSGLRAHAHIVDPPNAATSTNGGSHQHAGGTGSMNRNAAHGHTAGWMEGTPNANDDGDVLDSTGPTQGYVRWQIHVQATDTNHEHGFETDWRSTDHFHYLDIGAFWSNNSDQVNAAAAHENRPPYYALTYIIRKA